MYALRDKKIHDASRCYMIHHLEADDQKVRGGPGQGGSFGAFLVASDKAFLCPFWSFDFEISREFWANPHIMVIYIKPPFRRGERRSP